MAAAAQKKQPEKLTLYSLAREAMAECDGDIAKATKSVARRLRSDAKLLNSLLADILADAARAYCMTSQSQMRREIIAKAGRGEVVALANGLTAAFLDMPLAGGLRLRDANRAEVSEQSIRYDNLARDTGRKSKWLALIAQSIPANKKVGDVLTEDRVAELWQEAANA